MYIKTYISLGIPTTLTVETTVVISVLLTILTVLAAVILIYYYKKIKRRNSPKNWETNDLYYSLRVVNEECILPTWLKDKKEVIFPQQSLEKYQSLGAGQYGSVYKGKIMQGKAKCVMFDFKE